MYRIHQCCVVVLSLLLGACQVLNAPNGPATLSAQNTAFAAEATAMPAAIGGTAVAVAQTSVAARTAVAEISSINRQLIATLNVVVPATPKPQISTAGLVDTTGAAGTVAAPSGSVFVELGVTDRKRDSDGCADGMRTQFPVESPTIYAIGRSGSIAAGTVVEVEWKYQSQIITSGSYTLPNDENNFCIWFPLDPAAVPFTAGSWSVQFMVDEQPVEPTIFFNIGEAEASGG